MKQEPQGFVEEEEENLEDVEEEEEAQPKKKVKFIRKRNCTFKIRFSRLLSGLANDCVVHAICPRTQGSKLNVGQVGKMKPQCLYIGQEWIPFQ